MTQIGGNQKSSETNVTQCHYIHHKSHHKENETHWTKTFRTFHVVSFAITRLLESFANGNADAGIE
jgi:hypothetical protein